MNILIVWLIWLSLRNQSAQCCEDESWTSWLELLNGECCGRWSVPGLAAGHRLHNNCAHFIRLEHQAAQLQGGLESGPIWQHAQPRNDNQYENLDVICMKVLIATAVVSGWWCWWVIFACVYVSSAGLVQVCALTWPPQITVIIMRGLGVPCPHQYKYSVVLTSLSCY